MNISNFFHQLWRTLIAPPMLSIISLILLICVAHPMFAPLHDRPTLGSALIFGVWITAFLVTVNHIRLGLPSLVARSGGFFYPLLAGVLFVAATFLSGIPEDAYLAYTRTHAGDRIRLYHFYRACRLEGFPAAIEEFGEPPEDTHKDK